MTSRNERWSIFGILERIEQEKLLKMIIKENGSE